MFESFSPGKEISFPFDTSSHPSFVRLRKAKTVVDLFDVSGSQFGTTAHRVRLICFGALTSTGGFVRIVVTHYCKFM